jgi:hypothetical protein
MGEMGMHFHFGVSHRGRIVANPDGTAFLGITSG